MKKLLLLFSILILSSPSVFAKSLNSNSLTCRDMGDFENQINPTLPIMVDGVTEWLQVSINCDNTTIKYTKRLLGDESLLTEGWETNMQRHHTHLHCTEGVTLGGWTAMDVWLNQDYEHIATSITAPKDCDN